MPRNIANTWEAIADSIGDQPALIHGEKRVTWRQFEDRAARLSAAFAAAGLKAGSKIAVDLYNSSEWMESFFAAIKLCAVPANVNYRYLDQELVHLLTDADAEALVFHAALAPRILPLRDKLPRLRLLVQVDDGTNAAPADGVAGYEQLIAAHPPVERFERSPDNYYLSYTGGTTGLPKGVMANLGRLGSSTVFLGPMLDITPEQLSDPVGTAVQRTANGDRLIALPASPLMHSTGFTMTAVPALLYGGTVVLLTSRHFDPHEMCAAVERHRVRLIAIVGDAIGRPILRALEERAGAGEPYQLSSLRLVASAGVAWNSETKAGLFKHLPEAALLDACGASEGVTYGFRVYRKGDSLSGTNFQPAAGLKFLDEAGRPVDPQPGMTGLMINRTGTNGYYNDPEKTARTFRSVNGETYAAPGDYGRIEADGTLTLLGRGSTTINTGGEKVHPEEVEDIIRTLSGIDDCLVFGMPDERFGQSVTALVQPRQGHATSAADVIRYARERLAGYKAPKRVFLVARVPRGPNGKADYPAAKAMAGEAMSQA